MANAAAPIHPTDADSVVGVLAAQSDKHGRNVNDPNEWIYVDNAGFAAGLGPDQPWAPGFDNGFFNVGLPRVLLRYRLLRPYDPNTTQNAVQIQGSVSGGSLGLTIFTLRSARFFPDGTHPSPMPAFTMDSDIHLTCCDDAGGLVVVTIQASSGDVIYGFV